MEEKCVICDSSDVIFLLSISPLNNIYYCGNCYTLKNVSVRGERTSLLKTVKTCSQYNYKYYKNIIYNKIDDINKNNIKILNIGDKDTKILDSIVSDYRNVKCVSVSDRFTPSFFSKHYCYKDNFDIHIIDNLYNRFGSFDIILLNQTLNYVSDPCEILQLCRKLTNINTSIITLNYHSIYLPSFYFANMNNNMKYIYNTNSIKLLSKKCDLELTDVYKIDDTSDLRIFEIRNKNNNISNSVVETLYDDILKDTYADETYDTIRDFWNHNYNRYTDILKKYKSNRYKIIGVNFCKCCDINSFYHTNDYMDNLVYINDLSNILTNDNHTSYIFVIFDYNNFKSRCNQLKAELYKINFNSSLCLTFDIVDMISYPVG